MQRCIWGKTMPKGIFARKPRGKTPLKDRVACRGCDWTWRPYSGFGNEACPKCGKVRSVTVRTYEKKKNIASIAAFRSANPGYSKEWERRYRKRALMIVGRGLISCVRCQCDRLELIEINHKNGGGSKELRGLGHKWHRMIARLERHVDDLELLCKPCNSVHALELKYGPLPFRVVWDVKHVA